MFTRRYTIFRLFGFDVKIDLSWLILVFLVAWSLATGLFPYLYQGLSTQIYWWMAISGTIGLFFSIVVHEFSHSLVARRHGLPIKGITLFIFGGVSEMEQEPPSPKVEFLVAAAGPLSSILLSILCFGIYLLGRRSGWPQPFNGVLAYLASLNGLLAVFNMVPAFPLDGGRILRAGLWKWKKSLQSATRTAARIGSGFGLMLIVLGVIEVVRGDFMGGMWWFLIGWFLRNSAAMSYRSFIIRKALEGEPVRRFMTSSPVTVPPWISLRELLEDYMYKYHFKMFPVVEDSRLVGCITTGDLKEIPKEEWDRRTVAEVSGSCTADNTVSPETDALEALSTMNRQRTSRLMVVENGQLVGIIALKDLMAFLSIKFDLEQPE